MVVGLVILMKYWLNEPTKEQENMEPLRKKWLPREMQYISPFYPIWLKQKVVHRQISTNKEGKEPHKMFLALSPVICIEIQLTTIS